MPNSHIHRLLTTRARLTPAVLRALAGAIFVAYSLGKFRRHDSEVAAFDRYGIPAPDLAVYLVGTLELVGGVLLIVGLLSRPVALALIGNMIGALSSAGRVEPNFNHVGLPILLIVALAVIVVAGGGRWSIDRLISGRRSSSTSPHPG